MIEGKEAAGGENGGMRCEQHIRRCWHENLQREADDPRGGQNEGERSWRGKAGLVRLREDFLPPVRWQLAEGETFEIVLEGIGWRFHGFNSS